MNLNCYNRFDYIAHYRVQTQFMQIGELAKSANVTVQAIRFYERLGLLPSPPRKDSGYRIYCERDFRRLQFVKQAKRLGFSLDEIKTILQMRERGTRPCDEVVAMAKRHLDETEEQISSLVRFRDELSRVLRQWKHSKARIVPGDTICALIERTMDRSEGKKDRVRNEPTPLANVGTSDRLN